jgi:outer membrane protein assembly factor BamA
MLGHIEAVIEDHYQRFGYDNAKVRVVPKDTDDPREVVLQIAIVAGERRTISRRIFVIEPKYDLVLGKMKHDYDVGAGDPIDEDALREADNDMADQLKKAGFLAATVRHRVLRKGGHAFLYVYLETGPLHQFVFDGNVSQDDEDLEDALDLDTAVGDTEPEALAERVLAYYRARGFFDVRVEVEVRNLGEGALRELRFKITEGRPVAVVKRRFSCLPKDAPEGLGADDLGAEIDAKLQEELPGMPLLHEVEEVVVDEAFTPADGARAPPRRLEPAMTYTTEAYEHALEHLGEVLASKGYLNAVVGPVSIIRAECDPYARAGRCRPLPLPKLPPPSCPRDEGGLPAAGEPLSESYQCVPDPRRGIHCAPTMIVDIPVQLGPEMRLYDVVFEGNEVLTSPELLEIAAFPTDSPFSSIELDNAQTRIQNAYKDRGYAYATVRTEVDYSPDRTRARAHFIINEHKPVTIEEYEVRGAERTDSDLIIGRLALCQELEDCHGEERYFKQNLARQSEEQIATLGTFSSVTIALEDVEIPQSRKRVIITVVELPSQYIEPSLGFYTGDGLRVGFEYGHRNIARQAIALTLRLEFAILPEFLILDDDVRQNYEDLSVSERLERRNTGSLRFPDVKLGPNVDVVINGVDARDNQRDFGLTREALFPTINWRAARHLSLQLGVSAEVNDVTLFNAEDVEGAIRANPALANLLRVPDGRTVALAQRASITFDNRNRPLAATTGVLLSTAVEHVSAFPLDEETEIQSEFIKVTGRTAGYIPIGESGVALALSLAGGINVQLTSGSATYPDRLFYLGGVNTLRGFQLDEVVPEDVAQEVLDGEINIDEVGVRGGDLYVNPRAELRIPLSSLLSTGIFLDTGNLWSQVESIDSFVDLLKLRYTMGAGIRIETPLGPVAFDFGFKLVRHEWEDLFAAHFSIGLF